MPKGDRFKLKADPDDGTTPVSHLLLEAVSIADLNGTEKGLILYLWRQTYGWVKEGTRQKEARIPQDELAQRMSTSPKTVYSALKSLTNQNIITRRELGQGRGYIYKMNTDISTWNSHSIDVQQLKILARVEENFEGSQYLLPLKKTTTVPPIETNEELLPLKKTTTQGVKKTSGPTLYKEILNQYKASNLTEISEEEVKYFLPCKLIEMMLINNPQAKIPENLNAWVNEARLLLEKDKRTPEDIMKVIEFCQSDSFWKANILSMGKVREKFDQLYLKMKSSGGKYHGNIGAKKQPPGTGAPIQYIDGDAAAQGHKD
jgi:phage replication O-like protein O